MLNEPPLPDSIAWWATVPQAAETTVVNQTPGHRMFVSIEATHPI
jgi:hypothetical protein